MGWLRLSASVKSHTQSSSLTQSISSVFSRVSSAKHLNNERGESETHEVEVAAVIIYLKYAKSYMLESYMNFRICQTQMNSYYARGDVATKM